MKPKVLYIMGMGHSGSTLLDIVLGNHPQFEGVGELTKLHRSGWLNGEDRRCACGRRVEDCSFWVAVRECWVSSLGRNAIEDYIHLQNQFERHRLPQVSWVVLERWRRSKNFEDYTLMTSKLYEAIIQVSNKPIVVDSSKAPLRAYALELAQSVDAYYIHLIRDGRGVVWSYMKPKDRKKRPDAGIPRDFSPKPPWETILRWVFRNLEIEWVKKQVGLDRAVRIHYERFVQTPNKELILISKLMGEDLSELMKTIRIGHPLQVSHQVAGNSIRMKDQITIKPDFVWIEKLPQKTRRLYGLFASWLAYRYGYVDEK